MVGQRELSLPVQFFSVEQSFLQTEESKAQVCPSGGTHGAYEHGAVPGHLHVGGGTVGVQVLGVFQAQEEPVVSLDEERTHRD